ncbi:uncharacterized protein [Porites lutea]|uniref:uncharacterized protein n=1 Tax=Porites lutea TaxID=51062 RepID=UPI003CC63E55
MEKGFTCLVEITAVLSVLGLTFQVQGGAMIDRTLNYGCSRYTFYAESQRESVNFVKSRGRCKVNGSDLVSIESNEEWNFLKDTINKFQHSDGTEYFIGLTKDKDGLWRWISNNSTVNESYWALYQPGNESNIRCAVMYKDFNKNYGLFDDLSCAAQRHGYICEKPTCKPTTPKESDTPTSTTGPHSVPLSQSRSTKDGSKAIATTKFLLFVVFFFSAAVPEEVIDESPNITVIILILLAVIILALLIVFFIIFYHRRRRNKTKGTFCFFVRSTLFIHSRTT